MDEITVNGHAYIKKSLYDDVQRVLKETIELKVIKTATQTHQWTNELQTIKDAMKNMASLVLIYEAAAKNSTDRYSTWQELVTIARRVMKPNNP